MYKQAAVESPELSSRISTSVKTVVETKLNMLVGSLAVDKDELGDLPDSAKKTASDSMDGMTLQTPSYAYLCIVRQHVCIRVCAGTLWRSLSCR